MVTTQYWTASPPEDLQPILCKEVEIAGVSLKKGSLPEYVPAELVQAAGPV